MRVKKEWRRKDGTGNPVEFCWEQDGMVIVRIMRGMFCPQNETLTIPVETFWSEWEEVR